MTPDHVGETPDELFEDAPCGYVSTLPNGTIVVANRTFEAMIGRARDELVGKTKFQDLLPAAGRIYHETHYRPLLLLQGEAREIALELEHRDGSRIPVLLSSIVAARGDGSPGTIRTVVFPAAERRGYEEELLLAQRRDREIALQLQRSFLAGALPDAPGLELEVVYRPGVSGLESGGDWYDAFWLAEGETVALVIGDVVGSGLQAAGIMGQLRSATRAFASTGMPPHSLLESLDRYASTHETGEMTTVVYGELSLVEHTFRYSCAGHPPPLVSAHEGETFFAEDARFLPLAVTATPVSRESAILRLDRGATLVLYTDGLVEHPSRSLDVGMELLRRTVVESGDASPDVLAKRVLGRLRAADYTDDVCLLVARIAPPDDHAPRSRA